MEKGFLRSAVILRQQRHNFSLKTTKRWQKRGDSKLKLQQQAAIEVRYNACGEQGKYRVVERNGPHYWVQGIASDASGSIITCNVQHNADMDQIVVGDFVSVALTDLEGEGLITGREKRYNLLQRPESVTADKKKHLKSIASNIDRLVIVVSPSPLTPLSLIDRLLVATKHYRMNPIIVVNKSDLPQCEEYIKSLSYYEDKLGCPVIPISALCKSENSQKDGGDVGLKLLCEHLMNKTSVLVGQSGVGKSSIINYLSSQRQSLDTTLIDNADVARVGGLMKKGAVQMGSHTTSNARLFCVPYMRSSPANTGDMGDRNVDVSSSINSSSDQLQHISVIDSPGIREFGAWLLPQEAIQDGFKDIREASQRCKYRNCSHSKQEETTGNCAVCDDVFNGKIIESRLLNYRLLMQHT